MRSSLLALLSLLSACACPSEQAPAPAPDATELVAPAPPSRVVVERLRGVVSTGERGLRYQPCDAEQSLTVVGGAAGDLERVVAELMGDSDADGIYVEVVGALRGEGTSGGMVSVERLRMALPEAATSFCDYDAPYGYKAHGNEPFWNATVAVGELRFERLGDEEPFVAPAVERSATGDGSGPSWVVEDPERPLTLSLSPGECRDDMSGAYYPYEARLLFGETTYTGCAHEGWEGTVRSR